MIKVVKVLSLISNALLLCAMVFLISGEGVPTTFPESFIVLLFFFTPIITLVFFYQSSRFYLHSTTNKKMRYAAFAVFSISLILSSFVLLVSEKEEIYEAALFSIVTRDDTYGGKLNPSLIYLSQYTVSGPRENGDSELIPNEIQQSISSYSAEVGINIVWVKDRESLSYNEQGEIEGGGVLIAFSNLDRFLFWASLEANIYVANLAAGGTKYSFYTWFKGWRLYRHAQTWVS